MFVGFQLIEKMAKDTKNIKWRKIMYEDQGVPDNYVDQSFLVELKKNLYTRTYDYKSVVVESGVVTQQICRYFLSYNHFFHGHNMVNNLEVYLHSVCLFVVTFVYMDQGLLDPYWLLHGTGFVTFTGYLFNDYLDGGKERSQTSRTRWDDLKTVVIFFGVGYGLSPVLMTLTHTISTDTIYAMTAFMLLANLLFHDYINSSEAMSRVLSLNAAIFASVCLASRLPTALHAFVTVTFAVELFALCPVLRRKIKEETRYGEEVTTLLLCVLTLFAVLSVSSVAAVLVFLAIIFITFLCPALLIYLQPYKNNIYGPWDEAVIQD